MPAMPNEKTTAVSLSERNFNELKLKGLTSSSTSIVAATAAAAMATQAVTVKQQQQQQLKNCGCGIRYYENGSNNKHANGISSPTSVTSTGIRICCRLQNSISNEKMFGGSGNNVNSAAICIKSSRNRTNKNNNHNVHNHNNNNNNRNSLNQSSNCNHTSSSDNSRNLSHSLSELQQQQSHRNTNGHYDQLKHSVDNSDSASAATTETAPYKLNSKMGSASTSSSSSTGTAASGGLKMNSPMASNQTAKKTPKDFIFGKFIGEGSYSIVYLAVDVHTKKEYAIKVCEKRHILREGKQEYIRREREVLHQLTNVPGFVNLSCTFQDHRSLYFVMTYASNGDLLPHIIKVGSFDLKCTRHYAAELVLACEQMHSRNVVHRDLKPENILLDDNMHMLIADFGSVKILQGDEAKHTVGCSAFIGKEEPILPEQLQEAPAEAEADEQEDHTDDSADEVAGRKYRRKRKGSFVGTAQYVSPEVLNNRAVTPAADLWAMGCIIYQMIAGLPPFRGNTDYIIFREILANSLDFPEGFDADAKDLVTNLLKLEPMERLGALDVGKQYISIRNHAFFKGIDFDAVRQHTPPAIHPYLPGVSSESSEADFARTQYRVPENLEPGLDDKQITRLLCMELGTLVDDATPVPTKVLGGGGTSNTQTEQQVAAVNKNNFKLTHAEKELRLEQQKSDPWHAFCENEVILRKGFVNKRKGLFARKRMLLLTTGPRLIYIDPVQMVKKGEIPWTPALHVEAKNFKIFFVYTPNRTYYLEDPEGYSLHWVAAIEKMHALSFNNCEQQQQQKQQHSEDEKKTLNENKNSYISVNGTQNFTTKTATTTTTTTAI